MALWSKVKNYLEWAQLAKFVADLIISVASWKTIRLILGYVPQISHDWASAISLFAAGGILSLIVWWQQRRPKQSQTGVQSLVAQHASPANFDATTFFRHSYYSPLQAEIETNARRAATENQPNDREGFYVKLIAVGLISYNYDMIWSSIYRSQLLALLELNRQNGLLPLPAVKTYYDQAAIAHPTRYASYPFDEWLSYMKTNLLILHHPSDMIEITVRGKDFLKYLLHWGREADQRVL